MTGSGSAPSLLPPGAGPGGPWTLRGIGKSSRKLETTGKLVLVPPDNEAAAVAWRNRRKQTLHGQLGTGNKLTSVVQYPISCHDPHNLCRHEKNHLTAEDRRILRVMVKNLMRKRPNYPDSVYAVEKAIYHGFRDTPELCRAFFANEDMANRMLGEAADAYTFGHRPSTGHEKPNPGAPTQEVQWDDHFVLKTKFAHKSIVDGLAAKSASMASLNL